MRTLEESVKIAIEDKRHNMKVLPEGHWYACYYPERQADRITHFCASCKSCLIALEAAVIQGIIPTLKVWGRVENYPAVELINELKRQLTMEDNYA